MAVLQRGREPALFLILVGHQERVPSLQRA
jgi:hypothetical protein